MPAIRARAKATSPSAITAAAFAGQSRVDRQRAVYAALGDLIAPDRVHALVIEAKAPGEA